MVLFFTWFIVHLRPPAGTGSRPLTSRTAFSSSRMPFPVTAQVLTCILKVLLSMQNSTDADGARSILLITSIIGVDEFADFCNQKMKGSEWVR